MILKTRKLNGTHSRCQVSGKDDCETLAKMSCSVPVEAYDTSSISWTIPTYKIPSLKRHWKKKGVDCQSAKLSRHEGFEGI